MMLDDEMARRFAAIALGHVAREYPNKLDHVMDGDEDVRPPQVLHPVFFGSFDWHSCVHGWWTLFTLRRLFPNCAEADAIAVLAEESFTREKVGIELAYLTRASAAGFERPYGWAWLLYLHLEARRHLDQRWAATLEPLARAIGSRLSKYLGLLTYPIRAGTHSNTAFALILALEWADLLDAGLASVIRQRSAEWFSGDRDCQAWEPSGDDFLSSALVEALCMKRVLGEDRFGSWFTAFLPRTAGRLPASLFVPATVSDRSDGKIAHLDGLNLSRAWCWRSIAPALESKARHASIAAAEAHLAVAVPQVAGDYAGEHWLASFALLAMLAP